MKKLFGIWLSLVMLVHLMGSSLIVVNYELRKAQITELYCANKATPEMQCNGRCHLKKQLEADEESRNSPSAEVNAPVMWAVEQQLLEAPQVPVPATEVTFGGRYEDGHGTDVALSTFRPPRV